MFLRNQIQIWAIIIDTTANKKLHFWLFFYN